MKKNISQNKDLISAKQVSQILGISQATLSRIKNQIGYYKIGKNIKFSAENIKDYLKAVEYTPAEIIDRHIKKGGDEQC